MKRLKNAIRLDVYLTEKCLSSSRERAKREIIAGWVRVNGETVRKPSKIITGDEEIIIRRPKGDFVSRGGDKLYHALNYFIIVFGFFFRHSIHSSLVIFNRPVNCE